ncbi:MAG: putative addiction module antidote protein [Chloroflexi bacterium]|nr:putative addiction module antidote protein [Chloroflexota bacterium]
MAETFTPWDAADYIENPEDARLYLEAAIDEDPGDGSLIRAALGSIARSRNISALAQDAGLNRGNLYKALSDEGNPSFSTVLKVTRVLGLKLRVEVAS